MSFYKEESAAETINRVSNLASLHELSKRDVLSKLVDQGVEAHGRVAHILQSHKEAFQAFNYFAAGYIGFHVALNHRYRLSELNI